MNTEQSMFVKDRADRLIDQVFILNKKKFLLLRWELAALLQTDLPPHQSCSSFSLKIQAG